MWLPCLLAGAAALCGCASPGVPRPPSLRLPEMATNVEAERVGGEVRLTWTTPANTTDHDAIRGKVQAEVWRAAGSAGHLSAIAPLSQEAVVPGKSALVDALPGPARVGTVSLLEYRVELRNEHGRSAGLSEPAFAAAGRAPEMPAGVAAVARREGVLVTWQPEAGGAADTAMELRRTSPAGAKPATMPVKKAKAAVPFGGREKPVDGALVLTGDAGGGGLVDRTARDGETYTYVAQRVRRVKVDGRMLELRSLPSAPVTITVRDTFAPAPPRGLALVPGGGFGSPPSLDLSWEPNGEEDLVGYKVYRSTDGGAPVLLTAKPVGGPSFRDLAVAPGHTYGYRVTAVDQHGNESGPGSEVPETLR